MQKKTLRESSPDELRLERRQELFRKFIPDFASLHGLEIGALCSPTVTKDQGDILYYDRVPTEELIRMFGKDYNDKKIENVDIVSHDRPLEQVLDGRKFDYVVANHVIEHIPDFIGYFQSIHRLLRPGGKIFMAVPDRRFTFDQERAETTVGHVITDFEDGGSIDAASHELDALTYHAARPEIIWEDIRRQRYEFCHHHHVFNCETFVERLVEPLIRLQYLSFSLTALHYEPALLNEFIAVFERVDPIWNARILGKKIKIQPHAAGARKQRNESLPITQLEDIRKSEWFDDVWYLEQYPETRDSGLDPLRHYFFIGANKGFNPCPRFDSAAYWKDNPDVAYAKYNPLWHYVTHGRGEGRRIRPAESAKQ